MNEVLKFLKANEIVLRNEQLLRLLFSFYFWGYKNGVSVALKWCHVGRTVLLVTL